MPKAPVVEQKKESGESIRARVAITPTFQASLTIQQFNKSTGELDLAALNHHLLKQTEAVASGSLKDAEALLMSQAVALDAIFHSLSRKAQANNTSLDAFERLLRLGLKAQSQARATIETLGKVKNPQPIAFVRQANIAHGHQQVNNGAEGRAHETFSEQNELLEGVNGKRMDARKTGEAVAVDTKLEPLEVIDRPDV